MAATVALYSFIAVALLATLGILLVNKVFHSVLLLAVTMIAIAGIFILLHGELLAVVQIVAYAGGILLLLAFGVMLTVRQSEHRSITRISSAPLLMTGLLFVSLIYCINRFSWSSLFVGNMSPPQLGKALMTTHSAPFEIAGMLMLISLIAAIVAAKHGNKTP